MSKILVVDDDIDILELVRLILTRSGMEVRTIFRGEMVAEAIREFEPSLILMDISLGTIDGREICKALKRQDATRDIPIILFSANIEFQKNVGECQAEGFISKPFEMKQLLNTIQSKLK
ncbi:MAG TPA: response regulator [Puia sp.]|nr:response regulator [Puia sp.]